MSGFTFSDKFDDANLPGEMHITVTIKKVMVGTELNIVQEGIPDAIPVEMCYLGWQESLRNLAKRWSSRRSTSSNRERPEGVRTMQSTDYPRNINRL